MAGPSNAAGKGLAILACVSAISLAGCIRAPDIKCGLAQDPQEPQKPVWSGDPVTAICSTKLAYRDSRVTVTEAGPGDSVPWQSLSLYTEPGGIHVAYGRRATLLDPATPDPPGGMPLRPLDSGPLRAGQFLALCGVSNGYVTVWADGWPEARVKGGIMDVETCVRRDGT